MDVATAIKTKRNNNSTIYPEDFDTLILDLSTVIPQNKTVIPSTSQQIITADAGYNALGQVTVNAVTSSIDNNIVASNIKYGVTILGVAGNIQPDKPEQTKTCTPSTIQQVIEPDNGYELTSVTVNAVTSSIDNNIIAGNIKKDITILGVTGTLVEGGIDTSDATAGPGDILLNKTAYVNGVKLTGTLEGGTWIVPDGVKAAAASYKL